MVLRGGHGAAQEGQQPCDGRAGKGLTASNKKPQNGSGYAFRVPVRLKLRGISGHAVARWGAACPELALYQPIQLGMDCLATGGVDMWFAGKMAPKPPPDLDEPICQPAWRPAPQPG